MEPLLALIRQHLPHHAFRHARMLPASGQFNTVLCLDQRWIFRFPKSAHAAADLAHELEILPRLKGRLPLPIPAPVFSATDAKTDRLLFMGYAMLPGEPLLRERFQQLRRDSPAIERIARDLADFLRALHTTPPEALGLAATDRHDAHAEWTRFYADIRLQLFPFMRPDARSDVSRSFEAALSDPRLWRREPCLIHGDFGTGNILLQERRISGIIDFSFCNIGDPAQDLGALLSSYGADFAERVLLLLPSLRPHLPRARFYCGQYALLQALFALRDNDQAEFDDGIADYR